MGIENKSSRTRLKVRHEPYWQRIAKGAYVGFRRGPDTWVARYRDRTGKQAYQALHGAREYDDAKRQAESWFKTLGAGGTIRRGTVREALQTYLQWLRDQGRESTAETELERYTLIVWKDPIAAIPLPDLTREDMRDWRNRLRKGRQPRSINRHVRGVTAGLNKAHAEGYSGNPDSWKLTPLQDDIEDASEVLLLTPAQRAAIVAACTDAGADFCRALEQTGGRPGELAAATVADFDGKTLKLSHRKGRPAKLRVRSVVLPDTGIRLFRRLSKSKTPQAYLLTDPQGNPWNRHSWGDEIRAAINTANKNLRSKSRIPHDASAYSFRHSRISELLQVHRLDPVTVAAQTGTSVKVIERSYYKAIPAEIAKLLNCERL